MNKEEFEKKSTELLEKCNPSNYAKICMLLENTTKLNKNELNCVTKISQEVKGTEEYNLEYLPKYLGTLNKGETVRVSPTKYAWIKETMILIQYASQNSTRYMNAFTRLNKKEREKLPALMACFEEITTSAKKINTLTRRKKKETPSKKKDTPSKKATENKKPSENKKATAASSKENKEAPEASAVETAKA